MTMSHTQQERDYTNVLAFLIWYLQMKMACYQIWNIMASLGKSDHSVLCFQLNCYVKSDPYTSRHRNYNKGDYQLLRADLESTGTRF